MRTPRRRGSRREVRRSRTGSALSGAGRTPSAPAPRFEEGSPASPGRKRAEQSPDGPGRPPNEQPPGRAPGRLASNAHPRNISWPDARLRPPSECESSISGSSSTHQTTHRTLPRIGCCHSFQWPTNATAPSTTQATPPTASSGVAAHTPHPTRRSKRQTGKRAGRARNTRAAPYCSSQANGQTDRSPTARTGGTGVRCRLWQRRSQPETIIRKSSSKRGPLDENHSHRSHTRCNRCGH